MIEIKDLTKEFQTADGTVEALRNVNLNIQDGDIYGIIGMSGAGKSTLVRCINMLERPTKGQVLIDGQDIAKLSDKELRACLLYTSFVSVVIFNLLGDTIRDYMDPKNSHSR